MEAAHRILFGLGLALCLGTASAAPVAIIEPRADDLLYGPTVVRAEVEEPERVGQVLFYLDAFPRPVCVATGTPFECKFDAGLTFQGRRLRVRALDARGRLLGTDEIETLTFLEPERVVQHTLQVPVVAVLSAEKAPDLTAAELDCSFGGKACRVVQAGKLADQARFPVSLEILVDVSPSVDTDRDEFDRALRMVIDDAAVGVEVSISEFAGHYRNVVPFTSDKHRLRQGVLQLSQNVDYTCLYKAATRSLQRLRARPGHRMLFVLSDGEDTCSRQRDLSRMNGLYDMVLDSRLAGAPIYIFRFVQTQPHPRGSVTRQAYEGLARETGGQLFAHGNLYGLARALSALVDDLSNTWIVDLDLPRSVEEGAAARLSLEPPAESGLRLRYPEYWTPGSRHSDLIEMLASEDAATRHHAASRLIHRYGRGVLDGLLTALTGELEPENRIAQLSAINVVTAMLLLHGDVKDQKAALDAMEALGRIDPVLLDRLRPALRAYGKTEPPRRLRERAAAM